jgi:nucleoside-diphosphate-sugar epimerase
LIQGDILDVSHLKKAMKEATHVVHLAAIAGVDTVLENPVLTMKVNLMGTLHALEAACEASRVERFVDFSTSEVFGTHAYKVEETHQTSQGSVGEARWSYAVSKLAGEFLSHTFFHQYQLPAVTVRPFNIYGPNQVGVGAVHHFVVRALRGHDLIVRGDGSQIRAWCYIDDIVDAILLVLFKPEAVGQAFNIGNPRSTVTIYDLAQRVIRLSGSSSSIVFAPLNYTDVEIRVPNIDKARSLLGYEPKVDLEEGLTRTIEWYRRHL